MNRGDELTLHLESAAFEGKNIARLDGLVAFVLCGVGLSEDDRHAGASLARR